MARPDDLCHAPHVIELPFLTIAPDDNAVLELRAAWHWKIGAGWTPLLVTAFGDVFLRHSGPILWLNTGTGEVTQVAGSAEELETMLGVEASFEGWLMPGLVERLRAEGRLLQPGRYYSYTIFPVFKQGKYEPNNIITIPIRKHFGWSGSLHKQIQSIPDGGTVQMMVKPRLM